ncbi:MAG: PQQ-binding-like beta-propeller repeat protein [bacterium]|nr:PQQ-binding-like beta-propeller repeat protein [bacterium]
MLFALLEDGCTTTERAEVTAHVAVCDACRGELEAERALTVLLSPEPDAAPERAARWPRVAGVAAAVLAVALVARLPLGPKAYGSIVSSTLSPLVSWQDGGQEELRESNHVQIPAGTSATINIAGTGSVRAVGPAAFELDLAGGVWKVTLHNGQVDVTVLSGQVVHAASAWGTRTLEAGEHVLSPSTVAAGAGRGVEEIISTGFRAFSAQRWREAARDLLLAASHPEADEGDRARALFYAAAAQGNLDQHAEIVATVDRWLAIVDADTPGYDAARYWRAAAIDDLGRKDEARAIFETLLREYPDTVYAPYIRLRLKPSTPPRESEPEDQPERAPDDASVLWSFPTQAPSFGSAAAADLDGDGEREILFGTYFGDRHLYALRARTGELAWKLPSASGPRDASVLIADVDMDGDLDVLSADSATGVLECVDANSEPVWTTRLPSGTDSPPAAADLDGDGDIEVVVGTMKVRGGPGRVVALAGKDGSTLWSVEVPGHIQSEPCLCDVDADGVLDVLVTTWHGDDRLRALSGHDGKELWSFETGDSVYHGVSAWDFDGDERQELVVADRRGSVWMLEAESGEPKWKAQLTGEREGSVFAPTTLVDADGDGVPEIAVCGVGVHVLNADGRVLWERGFGNASIARGAVPGDVTGDGRPELVFGAGSRLVAVRPSDGVEVLSVELGTHNDPREDIDHAPLVLDADGDGKLEVFVVIGRGVYQGYENNYGRAVLVRTEGRATETQPEWLTFRGGARRTGSAE